MNNDHLLSLEVIKVSFKRVNFQVDTNKDRLVSLDEFLAATNKDEFLEKDEWQVRVR